MGIFPGKFPLFRYAAFHQKLITRMTFTCYKAKVPLLVISKMQSRFDTYMYKTNFITMFKSCLTFDSCFYGDLSVAWYQNTNMMNSE